MQSPRGLKLLPILAATFLRRLVNPDCVTLRCHNTARNQTTRGNLEFNDAFGVASIILAERISHAEGVVEESDSGDASCDAISTSDSQMPVYRCLPALSLDGQPYEG